MYELYLSSWGLQFTPFLSLKVTGDEGSWVYFGQGSKGNQDPEKYANKLLVERQRSILFFTTREPTADEARRRNTVAKRYRFEGLFGVRAWELYAPKTGRRAGDQLLLFHLLPAHGSYGLQLGESEEGEDETILQISGEGDGVDFTRLRTSLLDWEKLPLTGTLSSREYRKASTQIKKYARLRANGVCEYCDEPAPFVDINGLPFLEVHHIHRLADDGPDIPENVAAICPNCHRKAHFGREQEEFREEITRRIRLKERHLGETILQAGD